MRNGNERRIFASKQSFKLNLCHICRPNSRQGFCAENVVARIQFSGWWFLVAITLTFRRSVFLHRIDDKLDPINGMRQVFVWHISNIEKFTVSFSQPVNYSVFLSATVINSLCVDKNTLRATHHPHTIHTIPVNGGQSKNKK